MIKRYLWLTTGILSLICAYIGLVTPGIPFSIFLVFSAYCFSKSSPKLHKWLYNHKHFGPFLTNWNEHRIFPLKMKYMMVAMMCSSLIIMYFTVTNMIYIGITAAIMLCVAIWAWRYPSEINSK